MGAGQTAEEIEILAERISRPSCVETDSGGGSTANGETTTEQGVGRLIAATADQSSDIMERAEVGDAMSASYPASALFDHWAPGDHRWFATRQQLHHVDEVRRDLAIIVEEDDDLSVAGGEQNVARRW